MEIAGPRPGSDVVLPTSSSCRESAWLRCVEASRHADDRGRPARWPGWLLPPAAELLPLVLQRHELLQPCLEHSKALTQLRYKRLASGLQAAGRRGGRPGCVCIDAATTLSATDRRARAHTETAAQFAQAALWA